MIIVQSKHKRKRKIVKRKEREERNRERACAREDKVERGVGITGRRVGFNSGENDASWWRSRCRTFDSRS